MTGNTAMTAIPHSTDTLVVHCSDFRFQAAFRDFVRDTLGIAHYDLLAVPGGPLLLASPDYLPKFHWAGNRWTAFLVEAHQLMRAVLIAHDDCAWYFQTCGRQIDLHARQNQDLELAREHLRRMFPHVAVELHRARLAGAGITFEPVKAAA